MNVSRPAYDAGVLKSIVDAHMSADAAHDWSHIQRVWEHAKAIAHTEPATDWHVLQPAVFLHDVGDKIVGEGNELLNDATVARLLEPVAVPATKVPAITGAINAHSYSRRLEPPSLEAAILQDADRLDAIGAIGVARCFATGATRHRTLLESAQHFDEKLLKLRDGMNTVEGRRLAEERHAFLETFLAQFWREWPDQGEDSSSAEESPN